MLILSRKKGERLIIGDNIVVTVADVRGDKVRIAIQAPRDVAIVREELLADTQAIGDAGPLVNE